MHKIRVLTVSITLMIAFSLVVPSLGVSARPLAAPTEIGLGTAGNFAVLAGAAVNDTNISVVVGNVGLSPAAWPPAPALTCAEVTGTIYSVDASGPGCRVTNPGLLTTAKVDLTTAYNAAAARPTTSTIGTELGGANLLPGVYDSAATTFEIAAGQTLTLNGSGDPDSVFIFKMGTTLTTFANSKVVLTNGAQACNIFWQVGSSATLGTTSEFIGTIMADQSITDNGGSTVTGRFLARIAAVTLNNTHITRPLCSPSVTTTLSANPVSAGSYVSDASALLGDSSNSTGRVTYTVYSDSACILNPQVAGTKTVINGSVPNSDLVYFPTAGSFYWQASYSGDENNNSAKSVCTSELLTVKEILLPTVVPTVVPSVVPSVLPSTGFAPQRVSVLPAQPPKKAYASLGDVWLDIPRLKVQMPIVGIPQTDGTWDVSWLSNQAGWLQGTAFPSFEGNSVLTGHVYDAFGNPGPFVKINGLWWGDQVIIHAWGSQYIYEVRSVKQVAPWATASVLKHEELSWITLLTCRGYDEASNSYKYRIAVRAVLVDVK